MCDILVALPDATASGRVLFGKNSDRPSGETQVLFAGPETPRSSAPIRCAHVDVAPEPDPLRTIGCRPYWCWGYETGMNECGVVGGNTAVYTRSRHEPADEPYGLLGMELLRFGLERGTTAEQAVSVVVEKLEQYGQWGPAVQGVDAPAGCYENAFIFADSGEAWRLETAGRRWAAKRKRNGTLALSNQLAIRTEWTKSSADLVQHAAEKSWWKPGRGPFDFALAYSDHEGYARQVSHIRWMRANQLLSGAMGRLDVGTMMEFLRDHYENTFLGGPYFDACLPDFLTICMHESPADFTWGNTATSVVTEINPESPAATPYWVSYQPPCTSVYAAFFVGTKLPDFVTRVGCTGRRGNPASVEADRFSGESLWWRLYRILDAVKSSPEERRVELRRDFDRLEKDFKTLVDGIGKIGTSRGTKLFEDIQNKQIESIETVIEKLENKWGLTSGPTKERNGDE